MKIYNKKTISFIIIFILIITIGVSSFFFFRGNGKASEKDELLKVSEYAIINNEGVKINISEKLNIDKKNSELKISNIRLTEKDNDTLLEGVITNISGKDILEERTIKIKYVDEKGEELGIIYAVIMPLKSGESTALLASATSDYSNAYDFIIID